METGGFGGAGGNVVDAVAVTNFRTYHNDRYDVDIKVDVNYQYDEKDAKRLARKIPIEVGNFVIGDMISNYRVSGGSHEENAVLNSGTNSNFKEEIDRVISNHRLHGKMTTIAFPNCDNGHWRLFLVRFDPANPKVKKEFTIIDSLQDDAENVQAVFRDNILPILEDCGLDKVFSATAATPCKMINLGLQKTGIDGDLDQSNNREDCCPRMLKALRICAKHEIDDLKNPETLKTVLDLEGVPSPESVSVVREGIVGLQGQLFELEGKVNDDVSVVKGCLGDDTQEGALDEYLQLLRQDFVNDKALFALQNLQSDDVDLSEDIEDLMGIMGKSRALMDGQVAALKALLDDDINVVLDQCIENEKQAIEIRSEIALLRQKLGLLDRKTLDFALELRAEDAIALAEMGRDGDIVDGENMINYNFEGVVDFDELKMRVIEEGLAALGDEDARDDEDFMALPIPHQPTVADGLARPRTSSSDDDLMLSYKPLLPPSISGSNPDAIATEANHGSIEDDDFNFDTDEVINWVEAGTVLVPKTSPTSVGSDLGGLALDLNKRVTVPSSGPGASMDRKAVVSTSAAPNQKPGPHPHDTDATRPASRTSEEDDEHEMQ